MTLGDAGALYSLIDARQQRHVDCRAIADTLTPLITTWPCLTEATGIRRVFTPDHDFRIYRTVDGGAFDIVPPLA